MDDPTDFHPSLTVSRLITVAARIRSKRQQAVELRRQDLGDSNWGFGCRCYDFSRFGIARLADESKGWLEIISGGYKNAEGVTVLSNLEFAFSIGGCPLRFYRGDEERIPSNQVRRSFPELYSTQLPILERTSDETEQTFLSLAVEVLDSGEAGNILLVEAYDDCSPTGRTWLIPEVAIPSKISSFVKHKRAKELGTPPVTPKNGVEEKNDTE